MKRINLILSLMVLLLFLSGRPNAFQNEPDGFRGIKWGTELSTLTDMKFEKIENEYEPNKKLKDKPNETSLCEFFIYSRITDKLTIGDAKAKKIDYYFYRGYFAKAKVEFDNTGSDAWYQLGKIFTALYGDGHYSTNTNPNNKLGFCYQSYYWYGNTTGIFLSYSQDQIGTHLYQSLTLEIQASPLIDEYEYQKRKYEHQKTIREDKIFREKAKKYLESNH